MCVCMDKEGHLGVIVSSHLSIIEVATNFFPSIIKVLNFFLSNQIRRLELIEVSIWISKAKLTQVEKG